MGYMEDNAKKLNEALQRQFTSDLTWGMTREIATWAEKVALLEERIRELSTEVTRLANELARKYE
jgi:hypothetical protein